MRAYITSITRATTVRPTSGKPLTVSGKITDRYVKRRRTYIDYYLEVRAQDGRLVTTYTDKTLLKYTPDEV